MRYNPNSMMGLTALSPVVSAEQQYIQNQKNVPSNQVAKYVSDNINPMLGSLIATKQEVENAAKMQQQLAQQPQAAPPTVADQYRMAAMQQEQQARQAMMAQIAQARAAQQAQAAPGLAGMPNPVMERANFNGGGIVAMAGGGDVQHFQFGGTSDSSIFYVNSAGEASTDPYAELWKANAKKKQEAEAIIEAANKKRAAEAAAKAASAGEAEAAAAAAEGFGAGAAARTGLRALLPRLAGPAGVALTAYDAVKYAGSPEGQRHLAAATETTMEDPLMAGWGVKPKIDPNARPANATDLKSTRSDDAGLAAAYKDIVSKYGANSSQAKDFETKYRADRNLAQPAPTVQSAPTKDKKDTAQRSTTSTTRPAATVTDLKDASIVDSTDYADYLKKKLGIAPVESLEQYEAAQLKREMEGGYGRGSKALAQEEEFIKKQKEDYGADRKEAQKNFWIMMGASLLGNRSPHFATALGEAISQNYSGMIKDLRELKKGQDALEGQRIDIAYKREQALQSGTDKARTAHETALKNYNDNLVDVANRQEIIRAQLKEAADRNAMEMQRAREQNISQEKIANIGAGAKGTSADIAGDRAKADALNKDAAIQRAIVADLTGSYTAKQKADAQKRLNDISAQLQGLAYTGAGGTTYSGW